MPVHDVGYRAWNGRRIASYWRWWTISARGVALILKSKWIRRMLLFAWASVIYWAVSFFLFENFIETVRQGIPGQAAMAAMNELEGTPMGMVAEDEVERILARRLEQQIPLLRSSEAQQLAVVLADDDRAHSRRVFWTLMTLTFFRYPQAAMMVFLIGFIAPSLIANDMRSRAFLLYFSRPIRISDYILGKLGILAAFLIWTITLPALALYFFGVMLSPNVSVVAVTWDLPLRILLASVVVIIPTSLLALALSSLTQESRFASFAWFAVWGMGAGAHLAMQGNFMTRMLGSRGMLDGPILPSEDRWAFLSLYECLGGVQRWVFGAEVSNRTVLTSAVVLSGVTILSLLVLNRRIRQAVQT